MHFGNPTYLTHVREGICDGFVIGGGKSNVMRQGTLAGEAQMPFWLQLVGNGLTTTWAAHLGAVLSYATWPTISCISLYTHHLLKERVQVLGGYQKVPTAPGLGVEVDEEAVEQHRIPDADILPYLKRKQLYSHPPPRLINTAIFPDGSCIHMTKMSHQYFITQGPAYVEGARVESRPDDGSAEWTDLFERASKSPVRDRWSH